MSPRIRLIELPALRSDDTRIVEAVGSLPSASRADGADLCLAAVLNEDSKPYLEVQLQSVLECMHFVARMNSLGFRLVRGRTKWIRYSYVFERAERNSVR